jgi:ABC-type amino acid transport substrate-binding protein
MLKNLQKSKLLLLFMSLIFTMLFSQVANAVNSTFDRIKKNGVLLVGMSGEQPPFNFVSNLDTIIGYDVEITTALANSLGVKVRIELMPFPELMNALKEEKIDIIVSGFAFTEDRSKKITFVGPYALSGKSLLITKKRLQEIKESTGFNHQKVRLMALENSTSKTLAQNRLGKAKLVTVKHYEQALLALHSNQVDALVADLVICELAVIRDTTQRLTTLQNPLAVEEIGLAINKGEPLLESHLSAQLLTLSKSNDLKKLHDKWFNSPGWLALLP